MPTSHLAAAVGARLNAFAPRSASPRQVALVVVEYGPNRSGDMLMHLLARLPAGSVQLTERVRTDELPGHCLSDPNEAFEFSGYQEGLQRLLRHPDWAGSDDEKVVVFINDTISTGHATILAHRILLHLLSLNSQALSLPALVGLATPARGAILAATGGLGYASTYAFALIGSAAQLHRVHFYEADEVASRFAQHVLPRQSPDYVDSVRAWLEPEHPLMGWHNAIPGRRLDPATRLRKQLAIHLEHTMPQRLSRLGFAFIDIGSLLNPTQRLWLQLLRRVDRMYINSLKLRMRLPYLLGLESR